jgi:hypothetical protein
MKNTAEVRNTEELVEKSLMDSMTYKEYRILVSDHVQKRTSTGANQSKDLTQYTLLNDSRLRRLDKTSKVQADIFEKFENFGGNQTWLVITESWCGDAAQSLPIMNKLTEITEGISLKIVLRDEHPELMNAFLTNGSQSIPKIIVLDNEAHQLLGEWGPRPSIATEMVNSFKEKNGSLTSEFKQDLQVWYNKDKGENIAQDLVKLLN